MFVRWLSALGIATAILLTLAIPLSVIRLTLQYSAVGRSVLVYLADGSIGARWSGGAAPTSATAFEPPRYNIGAGYQSSLRDSLPSWHWLLPEHSAAVGVQAVAIPLLYLIVIALLPLALRAWLAARARRLRCRLGQCSKCGYDLRGSLGRCPECGTEAVARAAERETRVGPIGAAPVLVSMVALLALLAGGFMALDVHEIQAREAHALRALDYAWYAYATTPRLSGQIIWLDARSQIPPRGFSIPAGAIVLIDKNDVNLGESMKATDVTFVGLDSDLSVVHLSMSDADRVHFHNLTIECPDNPFAELRNGGRLQVTHCTVAGYNTGHGGNEPIFAVNLIGLIDSCTWDGVRGAQRGSGHRGVAFDLRGKDYLFVRGTNFIDNAEIARSVIGVFDGCVGSNPNGRGNEVSVRESNVWNRGNGPGIVFRGTSPPFTLASDEPAYVRAAQANGRTGDPVADRMLRHLQPYSEPRYWCAMLRSPNADIRRAAHARLTQMGFAAALNPPKIDIADALPRIAAGTPDANQLSLDILAAGPAARGALEGCVKSGPPAVKSAAELLLRAMDAYPAIHDEALFSRVANEIDKKK